MTQTPPSGPVAAAHHAGDVIRVDRHAGRRRLRTGAHTDNREQTGQSGREQGSNNSTHKALAIPLAPPAVVTENPASRGVVRGDGQF